MLLTEIGKEIPDLDKLNEAFNHINLVYRDWVENELQSQSALSPQHKNASPPRVLIDQNVMFEEIFQKIGSEPDLRKTETLLLAYFNSLAEHGIPSQFNLNKLLVSSLVSCLAGNFIFVRGKLTGASKQISGHVPATSVRRHTRLETNGRATVIIG